MQKLRTKLKKKVDTKASKGRKVGKKCTCRSLSEMDSNINQPEPFLEIMYRFDYLWGESHKSNTFLPKCVKPCIFSGAIRHPC